MKIEKLRLKDFIGIRRGLGLNEITIDFSSADGLVAFAGQNGLGKSTILENLHPYNTLASRGGALFNHVCSRSAEKELSFEYNRSRYRTLLKIDCQSGKSEGFIWKDGESLVNGKIRDYSKKINEIFGSENLFFNSVFCAQNATKLSDMTTGELKGLFAEFLRLDRLQGFEERAKQKINILSGMASQIDVNIQSLNMRLESSKSLHSEIERLTSLKAEQETYKTEQSEKLQTGQAERERLKETIARNEVLCKHADEIAAVIKEIENRRAAESKDVENQLSKLRAQYKALAAEIAEADGIIANEAEITAAAGKITKLNSQIEILTANAELANTVLSETQERIHALETEIQKLRNDLKQTGNDSTLSGIERDISTFKQKILACDGQLKALDKRHPECTINGCSFIVAAVQAKEELPGLTDRLEQLKIGWENRKSELAASANDISNQIAGKEALLKKERSDISGHQSIQSANRQELANARRELSLLQNVAEKQAALAVAKSKKEDRLIALEENKTQGKAISEAWSKKKDALDDQITDQYAKIDEIKLHIADTANDELKGIDAEIAKTMAQIKTAEQSISETSSKIAKLQGELSGMQEAEEQLKKSTEEKSRVNANISDWTYLRNACGKNGLQAMEIDGAAPIITGFANEILSQAFGSLYTVKFRTQDDEGKECLDIITITDDGEEVLLDNLSGGQRVWILMALRLAMTLLSKEKGGRNFETAFFDEMDGALDPDNAVNFVNLYKSFMDIGHFTTIPFISHKPECRSMADHVLMFEAGKNPTWQ